MIHPEALLDYQGFCISLYDLLRGGLNISLTEFMLLPEVEMAYKSGKPPELLARDAINLTRARMERAKEIAEQKKRSRNNKKSRK